MTFIRDVLHGRGQQAWPHTPTIAVVITAVVLGAVHHRRSSPGRSG